MTPVVNVMRVLCRSGLLVSLAFSFCLCAAPARAQDVPFAFLIQDGWSKLFQGQAVRSDHALTTWRARTAFQTIVNGQKGAVVGTALINAWSRNVSEPYFAPLGSVVGVVTLNFGPFRGHLTVFDTPSGLQTTIGIVDSFGLVATNVSGVWVYGNGTSVGGGSVNDMVVAGIVHFGQPVAVGDVAVGISQYFGPPASDIEPFAASVVSNTVAIGSFFGFAQGPLKVYRRNDQQWTGSSDDVSVLVMSMGGGYAVMVCTAIIEVPTPGFLDRCTVSGAGEGLLSRLTGSLTSRTPNWTLHWSAYIAP
jgi:hypothetical protein